MGHTRRKQILELLAQSPQTIRSLAERFELGVNDTAEEVSHALRSLRDGRLRVGPAECESCGFVFEKRKRLKTPSRCPRCKGERIMDPVFWIETANS
jgi:hypothetical protein